MSETKKLGNRTAPGELPALSMSGFHLRAILDTMPEAMVVIDTHGRIVAFSTSAERMFGYREAEILGENVSILMPSPDRENHDHYLKQYLTSGEKKIIGIGRVTTARHRDGITFPIDLAIGEAQLAEERVFTGFIHNLAETRETERQVHQLQSELAHVSRISSMGTLATSIAHELNQPLTAIANYAEAARDLLNEPDDEAIRTVREALDECAAETMRAGQIVRRLRDFISSGESEREIASLGRLVNEASALALINGDGREVDVEIKLDPTGDSVLVDPIQIQQVVLNLIRNALEAMADSPIKRLQIISRKIEEGFVEVTVADSGPGLDPKVAERLFHPFVSTKASGMGLGLSICHTIVNGHGGRIWAMPSELGGTAFHFTLMDAELERDDG